MALTKKTKQVPKKKFGTKKKTLKRYNKTQKGGGNAGVKETKPSKATRESKAAQRAAKAAAAAEASKLFPGNAVPNRKTGIFSKFSGLSRLGGLFGPQTKPVPQPVPQPELETDFLKQITPAEVEKPHIEIQLQELGQEKGAQYGIPGWIRKGMETQAIARAKQMGFGSHSSELKNYLEKIKGSVDLQIRTSLPENNRGFYTELPEEKKEKLRIAFGKIMQQGEVVMPPANKNSGTNPTLPIISPPTEEFIKYYKQLQAALPASSA